MHISNLRKMNKEKIEEVVELVFLTIAILGYVITLVLGYGGF
jgi:hypothetical protein